MYSNPVQRRANIRAFERRYGARGRSVYGKVVGKVRREQVASGRRRRVTWVRPHMARNPGSRHRHHVAGHRMKVL